MMEEVARWREAFLEKYGDSDLEELPGESIPLETLANALRARPFFADHRLVIVKDFLSTRKADDSNAILPWLNQIPEETFVLFVESHPDKRTSAFKALSTQATQRLFLTPKVPN